jgi:hypothetical protein
MNRPQTFITTQNLNIAAYIMAVAGDDCQISFSGNGRASFIFQSNPATRNALLNYEQGGLVEGAKLLRLRDQLFRRIRGGKQ